MSTKSICVLGSTGSIGTQTLDIVTRFPERYRVTALTAGRNIELLRQQIAEFRPQVVSVLTDADRALLSPEFPGVRFECGAAGVIAALNESQAEIVVVGIVGFAALAPTMEAIRLGKRLALANKEALVVAGHLVKRELAKSRAELIPVDSEHNALFQLLQDQDRKKISRLVLTASGGPLLRRPEIPLEDVTPELAVRHPNWKMGPKISVDSATLMNKGLELIEACQLFDVTPEQVEVWIHPQSIVHGALWFEDNSCIAHLSRPDMRGAIGYALSYPDRIPEVMPKLSLQEMSKLEFLPPDEGRFPALRLAREAYHSGPAHLVTLNAANEVAVQAFLNGQLLFPEMASCIEAALNRQVNGSVDDIQGIEDLDASARKFATEWVMTT